MILGINAFHGDASAALFADGTLVAAAEEERFTRVKHASGMPFEAARWVLEAGGVRPADVTHVAVSRSPHVHRARRGLHVVAEVLHTHRLPRESVAARSKILSVGQALEQVLGAPVADGRFHHVEHHPAHLASAFFASGLDEAAVCSVDGIGDFVSMAWGVGRGTTMRVERRVFFPHSLGLFYTAITQFLGFPHYGDEYKVMGLAPYGTPRFLPEMRRLLPATDDAFRLDLRFFRHARERVEWRVDGGAPIVGSLFSPALEDLFGPARQPSEELNQHHRDIAASVQARLEEVLLPILDRLSRRTRIKALAMAGGVALNVTTNTKIEDATSFSSVYIQPAAGDAGTSVGAALYVAHEVLGRPRSFRMDHAYYGPEYTTEQCRLALDAVGMAYEELDDAALSRRTAQLIVEGRIVGWFQGRMEFGPRALGNRSILCDPRNPGMKDILNTRTKRRESFRPFAPSVLIERAEEVFVWRGASPFMLFAPPVREEWKARIPAVTHIDGTARIQTVDRRSNPKYWALLAAFAELTGVPVLLNTSFNENEPIVMTPEHAIACFLRADMDVLVLENLLVTRVP